MNAFMKRIVLFVIGIPALYALITFLPQARHIGFNVIVIAASLVGSLEFEYILIARGMPIIHGLAAASGLLLPLSAYLDNFVALPVSMSSMVFILLLCFALAREIFAQDESTYPEILPRMGQSVLSVLYPGYFMSFAARLSSLSYPQETIFVFLILVFANDTLAYIVGMLFGEKTRGVCPISPRKSMAGFIGGFAGSCAAAWISFATVPEVFGNSLLCALIAGLCLGVSTIAGDLIESAMKRSAHIKDSGTIMLGRGGILDSIDSILFSAPIFYYILVLGR